MVVAARKIHKKVHIAVGAFFTPGHGAKHADSAGSVPAAQCVYEIAFCMQFVKQHHDCF
jgi:hypothetical protein